MADDPRPILGIDEGEHADGHHPVSVPDSGAVVQRNVTVPIPKRRMSIRSMTSKGTESTSLRV